MTVPTQWPEWFDNTYTRDKGGHYIAPVQPTRVLEPTPEGHDYASLFAKHGRPFGVFEQGRQLPYGAK